MGFLIKFIHLSVQIGSKWIFIKWIHLSVQIVSMWVFIKWIHLSVQIGCIWVFIKWIHLSVQIGSMWVFHQVDPFECAYCIYVGFHQVDPFECATGMYVGFIKWINLNVPINWICEDSPIYCYHKWEFETLAYIIPLANNHRNIKQSQYFLNVIYLLLCNNSTKCNSCRT